MGFFSKITNTVKGIASNPTNLKNYADLGLEGVTGGQVDTGGVNGMGSFSDMLLGKKAKDINPDEIANQIRSSQMKGLGQLNSALDTPADSIINNQVNQQKQGLLTSAQDARRNVQRTMAQQGLKGTSLGLGINRSINQDLGNNIAQLNASTPGMIRNQQIQDATTRINAGGLARPDAINFNTIQGQRSGGVLGIASQLAPIVSSGAKLAAVL